MPARWGSLGRVMGSDGSRTRNCAINRPVDHPRPSHPSAFLVPESGQQEGECRAWALVKTDTPDLIMQAPQSERHLGKHGLLGGSDSRNTTVQRRFIVIEVHGTGGTWSHASRL